MINNIDFTKKEFTENENIFKFDNNKYNFAELIKINLNKYFGTNFDLNELDKLINNEYMNEEELNYFKKVNIWETDRDSIFIKIHHQYIDSNNEFNDLYINFIKTFIKPTFFPNEESIVIQKTPNIRIQLPNKSNLGKKDSDPNNEIIGMHYDFEFGHDEEEINLIIPMTDMYESNSIYHEFYVDSNANYNDYNSLRLNINEIAFLYLNKWKHYNRINKTGKTRVSFDLRIIPFSKYKNSNKVSLKYNKKFCLGDYYIKV